MKKTLLLLPLILGAGTVYATESTDTSSSVVSSSTEEKETQSTSTTAETKEDTKETATTEETKESATKTTTSSTKEDSKDETTSKAKSTKSSRATVKNSLDLSEWDYKVATRSGTGIDGNTFTEYVIELKKYKGDDTKLSLPARYTGTKPDGWPSSQSWDSSTGAALYLHNEEGNDKIFPMDLEEISITSTNSTKKMSVEGEANLFKGRTKLVKANLKDLNTARATSFKDMFKDCTSLTEVSDLGWFPMYDVTSTESMFENCTSLRSLEITYQTANQLKTMDRMFYNTPNLTYLNLTGFETKISNPSTTDMFYCDEKAPLLVDVSSLSTSSNMRQAMEAHDFDKDNRIVPGPYLDANGGQFSDGSSKQTYWPSCLLTNSSLKAISNLSSFIKNTPTLTGSNFLGWNILNEPTTKNSMLNYLDTTYEAKWDLVTPTTSPDNTKLTDKPGALGFLYYPTAFNTDETTLEEKGSQSIDVNKTQSFNVGVRYGGTKTKWKVYGKVTWDSDKSQGIEIKSEGGKASVNENSASSYSPSKLTTAPSTIKGADSLMLDSSDSLIMENTSTDTKQAVYDYDFGNLSLYMDDVTTVPEGTHTGTVTWTLATAP